MSVLKQNFFSKNNYFLNIRIFQKNFFSQKEFPIKKELLFQKEFPIKKKKFVSGKNFLFRKRRIQLLKIKNYFHYLSIR